MADEVAAAILNLVRGPQDLESTTRGLLDFLQKASGVSSTYLTVIHWDDAKQEILVSNNTGDLLINEGLLVDWCDTLCRRALMGGPSVTNDVPGVYGDSDAAQDLGLICYVSVPVTMPDGSVFGTLCGASGQKAELDDQTLALFGFAAELIAGHLHRDRHVSVERARAQAAERRFRSQTVALAAVQHQLKTPLAVLSGWADLLSTAEGVAADDLPKMATAIGRQVRSLRSAVDSLLATALDDREPSLELRVMNIAPMLLEVVADHRRGNTDREWSIEVAQPLFAAIDPGGLEQAIAHLLDNALKYSGDGTSISFSAERVEGDVSIMVSDEGSGLPDDAEALFEPFARDGGSRADSVGLGLYIVRGIVTAHHGTVTATRRERGGSSFEIRLPASLL